MLMNKAQKPSHAQAVLIIHRAHQVQKKQITNHSWMFLSCSLTIHVWKPSQKRNWKVAIRAITLDGSAYTNNCWALWNIACADTTTTYIYTRAYQKGVVWDRVLDMFKQSRAFVHTFSDSFICSICQYFLTWSEMYIRSDAYLLPADV